MDSFHGIVGRSPIMRGVFERLQRLAAAGAPVLIVGETGTGKELAARAIHASSPRADKPFVPVNCAALPRDLFESELFGHRRGAFSGAAIEYLGMIRAAGGGSLLLDEITEMDTQMQAKLLRVIQERRLRPVGCVAEVAVDVRVIATSNREPGAALSGGILRQDLYYRLAAHTVALPPLRQRSDDVPLLVEYYVALFSRRYGRTGRGVSPEALAWLRRQPWRGNVRELCNVLENAVIEAGDREIDLGDLTTMAPEVPPASQDDPGEAVLPTLRQAEGTLVRRALAKAHGNKMRAARLLGVSRKTLYAKMEKYGVACLLAATVSAVSVASTPVGARAATITPARTPTPVPCCSGSSCCAHLFGEPCILEYAGSGRVTDARTGLPISGAMVSIRPGAILAVTQEDGSYSFRGSVPETCNIDYCFSLVAVVAGYRTGFFHTPCTTDVRHLVADVALEPLESPLPSLTPTASPSVTPTASPPVTATTSPPASVVSAGSDGCSMSTSRGFRGRGAFAAVMPLLPFLLWRRASRYTRPD